MHLKEVLAAEFSSGSRFNLVATKSQTATLLFCLGLCEFFFFFSVSLTEYLVWYQ